MRRTLLAVALCVGLLAGACGDSEEVQQADARSITPLDADGLPAKLLDLSVAREDIAEVLDATKRPYLDEAGLYSLREDDTLQATLQIGHFADSVDYESEEFRSTILTTLGNGSAREVRLGAETVYMITGDRQQVAVWFDEDYLMVLSTREEYETPRSLLRATLEVHP